MNERLFVLNINERNNFELFGVSPIPFLGFAINDNLLGLIDNKYKLHEYPLNKKLLNHTQTKFTYLPSKRNRRDKVVMKYRNGTNDLDFIMEWHAITHHPFGTNKNDINLSGSFPMLDINVSKTNEVLYYCDGWKEFEAGNINQAQAIYYNFKLNKYCAKKIFKSDEANVLQIANTIEKFLITDAEDFLIYNTFNTNALGVYDIRQKSNVLIYLDTIINSYTLTKNDSFAVVSNANQLFLSSLKTHELNIAINMAPLSGVKNLKYLKTTNSFICSSGKSVYQFLVNDNQTITIINEMLLDSNSIIDLQISPNEKYIAVSTE